jgi:PhnB protein
MADKEGSLQVTPCLSFKGDCEAAFQFYAQCLGGEVGTLFRFGGSPMSSQAPEDWQDKVMHGGVTIGQLELMGADVAPAGYEAPKGFSLSIQIKSVAEAERIFGELGRDGNVVMPLEKTFWAERFGMVVDRFGIPWLINCEG